MIQHYLLHKDLQVLIIIFFHKMYIFHFNLKKYTIGYTKFSSLTIICEIWKIREFT